MKELKRIDFESGKFTANGVEYTIEGALSIERYAEFNLYEKELAYGFTVKALFEKVKKMWDNSNKLKFAENAVIQNDIMRGLAAAEERTPVILKICALFMNAPDEDRNRINQDMIDKKIADWKAEGMDMRDFFQVASGSVNGFSEIYETVTRIILTQDGEKAE